MHKGWNRIVFVKIIHLLVSVNVYLKCIKTDAGHVQQLENCKNAVSVE